MAPTFPGHGHPRVDKATGAGVAAAYPAVVDTSRADPALAWWGAAVMLVFGAGVGIRKRLQAPQSS